MRQDAAPLKGTKEHRQTQPAPPPPPGQRVVRDDGAMPLVLELALVGGFFGLFVWALPDIAAWLRSLPAPVHTSAHVRCEPPSEHETRLVYLNTGADGSLHLTCGPMVGGRGAYPGARP